MAHRVDTRWKEDVGGELAALSMRMTWIAQDYIDIAVRPNDRRAPQLDRGLL